jgi:hypothetical protein
MTNFKNDEEVELRDGVVVRVPMYMMDHYRAVLSDGLTGAMHRPGHRFVSDEQAQARETMADAIEAYEADLTNRWQNAAPAPHIESKDADPTSTREQAYAIYDAELASRWAR